jgi:hypothetical protein
MHIKKLLFLLMVLFYVPSAFAQTQYPGMIYVCNTGNLVTGYAGVPGWYQTPSHYYPTACYYYPTGSWGYGGNGANGGNAGNGGTTGTGTPPSSATVRHFSVNYDDFSCDLGYAQQLEMGRAAFRETPYSFNEMLVGSTVTVIGGSDAYETFRLTSNNGIDNYTVEPVLPGCVNGNQGGNGGPP